MALIDLVQAKVKDDSGRLEVPDDYTPAIDAALERYSVHRPKLAPVDVAGAGTSDVDLPVAYVDGFSQVIQVEFPIGENPESIIADDCWRVYRTPSGPVLRLLDETPTADETLRLTITVPRVEADILMGDLDAVAALAASFCLDTLANLFASTNDPTISADVVNYRSKSGEYARRAKDMRRLYLEHIGVGADGGPPASFAVAPPPSRYNGLTHWRR